MRRSHATALAAALLAAVACRAQEREGARDPVRRDSGAAVAVSAPGDSLRLSLVAPREVRAGERVAVTLRLENAAARPLTLYLRGRDVTFDLVVTSSGGAEVWRLLEDEAIPAVVQLVSLGPGEAIERGASWDLRTRGGVAVPGEYMLHARLLTEGDALATAPVPLRIVAR